LRLAGCCHGNNEGDAFTRHWQQRRTRDPDAAGSRADQIVTSIKSFVEKDEREKIINQPDKAKQISTRRNDTKEVPSAMKNEITSSCIIIAGLSCKNEVVSFEHYFPSCANSSTNVATAPRPVLSITFRLFHSETLNRTLSQVPTSWSLGTFVFPSVIFFPSSVFQPLLPYLK
jgi:hypothetical protein